jgi:hypothetical protein
MVFNFSFVPIVYFFYPETAGRTLEDLDRYFESDAGKKIIVCKDKVATSSKRPLEFIEREEMQVRRASSVNPQAASLAAGHHRARSIDFNPDADAEKQGVYGKENVDT